MECKDKCKDRTSGEHKEEIIAIRMYEGIDYNILDMAVKALHKKGFKYPKPIIITKKYNKEGKLKSINVDDVKIP